MELINNMETWQEYSRIRKGLDDGTISRYRDGLSIPSEIRNLYEREKPLTPADISEKLIKEMFIASCKKFTWSFDIDANNEKVIELFIQYLRRDERFLKADSSFRFSKGLLLRGHVGTGKTVLMKGFSHLKLQLNFFNITSDERFYNPPANNILCITSNDIVQRYSLDGYLIFEQAVGERKIPYVDLIRQPIIIDDIGSEPEAVYFGSKLNVIAEVILKRYEKVAMTHATSNLDADSLGKVYGIRILDRMREMFNDITLTGDSRR